jgi:hypothetical protein
MERTRVMTLGGLGRMEPRLRTNFLNPPRTTPPEPQNLLRQTMLSGIGRTGRMLWGLGQTVEDLVSGPTEDVVNQYLEQPLAPAGQSVPTPDAPILGPAGAQMPGGDVMHLRFNEDNQPVDVITNPGANSVNGNGASGGGYLSLPFLGGQQQIGLGAAIGWGSLALLSGLISGYHGYVRDRGSFGSAVGWFTLGTMFPIITPAVAIFARPGYAKPRRR